jgi:hypothetical protein
MGPLVELPFALLFEYTLPSIICNPQLNPFAIVYQCVLYVFQMRRYNRAVLRFATAAEDKGRLEEIVKALNSPSEAGAELRKLVTLWQESGPNTARLCDENDDLWAEMERVWKNTSGLWPTQSGGARLEFITNIGTDSTLAALGGTPFRTKAVALFNSLLVSPVWEKLAGPCARCGNYYIKKRASQKVYCSRRCGNAATAVARTRKRIADERKDKLLRAKAAMREWRTARTQQDWKHWVAERTGVDPRFLTRAVNKKHLQPPTKGRKP